jgi:hypothetical protein
MTQLTEAVVALTAAYRVQDFRSSADKKRGRALLFLPQTCTRRETQLHNMRYTLQAFLLLVRAFAALVQTPKGTAFEVVSVKPSTLVAG